MIIFPAMDLREGKCVRLIRGEFSTAQVVGEDPVAIAQGFKESGAQWIHMVDLDGALMGDLKNINVIADVVNKVKLPLHLGGGIRSLKTIEELLTAGVDRVILGTAALKDPGLVAEAVRNYGKAVAVGIDARDGYVAIEGWLETSSVNYIDFGKRMEDIGVGTIIFTVISRDGTLMGPNLEAVVKLNESIFCDIIA
jgi:phosphoribosylformimino-5-aminoimidazole carboxamide ribotide isomerase